MILDVVDPVLQVAVALGEVHLQEVAQQILQFSTEVRREPDLKFGWHWKLALSYKRIRPRLENSTLNDDWCARLVWVQVTWLTHTQSVNQGWGWWDLPFLTRSSRKFGWADQQRRVDTQRPFHTWELLRPTNPQLCCIPEIALNMVISFGFLLPSVPCSGWSRGPSTREYHTGSTSGPWPALRTQSLWSSGSPCCR